MNNRLLVFAILLGAVFAGVTARASDQGKQTRIVDKNNSLRHLVPDRWWEKAAAYGYGFYEVMPFKNGALFPPGP